MSGNGALCGGRGNDAGGRASSTASIPPASRKIVQSIKEIVNYPEQEIYAMLKECNMDPSETVNRLLNQDTFQEVKSKRDKKKEIKDTLDSRARGVTTATNRGDRAGNDRATRVGSYNSSSGDYGMSHSKPFHKKEHATNTIPSSSILGSGVSGNANHIYPPSTISSDTPVQEVSATNGISLSSKLSMGLQRAWSCAHGQVSMADIVRMGRPHAKLAKPSSEIPDMLCNSVGANNFQINAKHATSHVLPSESPQEWHSSQDPVPKVSEAIHESITAVIDENIPLDELPLVNRLPSENRSSMLVTSNASASLVEESESSKMNDNGPHLHLSSSADEIENTNANMNLESIAVTGSTESDSSCDGQAEIADSGCRLNYSDSLFKNDTPYQSQRHTFDHQKDDGVNSNVLSVAADLHHLSIQKEEINCNSAEDKLAVIFPTHLQVTSADCSHLSFGSFGSGLSASISESLVQKTLMSNLEPATTSEMSSFDYADTRNAELYNNEQSKSIVDENSAPRASGATENYDQSSSSQSTGVETDSTRPTNELHYSVPSLTSGHAFSSTTQPTAAEFNHTDTSPQAPNLASLSSMMNFVQQAYANSLQSNLIASTAQPGQEFVASFLPVPATQSMPTKYSTVMPSISDPTISVPETVKSSFFSVSQVQQPTSQTSQSLESSSIPTGPNVPQHLPVHPYSQPALPLGHFTNMIGYPFLPPSYAFVPSAFQPTYTGNSAYHQSPTTAQTAGAKYTLPQYKNSVSLTSLSQSAAIPSGYGGFGSSANIPASFVLNPPSAPANTTLNFEDTLSSQYKEANPYVSLQQSDNNSMWVQGSGSRTLSALPANTYYSMQGQNQHGGFRQTQQQPSQYGVQGYQNFYRSQVGLSPEHQQTPSDMSNLSNSHGLPSQSSHQLWQRNY